MSRPIGFTILGLYFGWKALNGFLSAIGVGLDPPGDEGGPGGLSLLTAVFAAVAAEALWRCRPWCARATIGYFAAAILASLVTSATDGLGPVEVVFSLVGKSIIFAIPVSYVEYRASQILASSPAPAPVAIPAPRP